MNIGKSNVVGLLRHVVNTVAMGKEYQGWSTEFSHRQAVEALENVQEELKKLDFTELSAEELYELGFSKWSEEMPNVYLIPLYLYPCIPDGTELTCIDGGKYTKGVHAIDNDVRFGCLAYGITVEEPEVLSVSQLGAVGQIGEMLHGD